MKNKILFILLFFIVIHNVIAQRPLEIFVDFPPPYPTQLGDYDLTSGKYSIIVFNHTTVDQSIYFKARLSGLDNNVSILLKDNFKPIQALIIPPQIYYNVTREELEETHSNLTTNDLEVNNINLLTGSIPPGRYELCIVAYDFASNVQLSIGCSLEFEIGNGNALTLVQPINNAELDVNSPPQFIWELDNFSRIDNISYTLEIIDITNLPNIDIEAEFSQIEPKFFAVSDLTELQYFWGNGSIPEPDSFQIGHQYAVRVRIVDALNEVQFQNDGYSQIHRFTYGLAGSSDDEEIPIPEDCETRCNVALPGNLSPSSLGSRTSITCGFFVINDLNLSESNRKLNGEGITRLSFLNDIGVRVKLQDVKVNSEGKVIEGEIVGVPDQNDPSLTSIISELGLDQVNNIISGTTDAALGHIPPDRQDQLGDLIRNGHMISQIASSGNVGMPIGISQSFEGSEITLGITGLLIKPDGAKCKIVAGLKLNVGDQFRWFMVVGDSICIAPNGFGGEYIVGLGADLIIGDEDDGSSLDFRFKGNLNNDDRCYFQMDCSGLKGFNINGAVGVPRSVLVPVNESGTVINGEKVRANFQFKLENRTSESELDGTTQVIVGLNFPACQFPGMEGWTLKLENAFLDMSDNENPSGITFPATYAGDKNNFKGIYVKQIKIRIPKDFIDDTSKLIQIDNLLFDPHAYIDAKVVNVFDLDDGGKLGGFNISISEFGIKISNNEFDSLYIKGEISLPINKEGEGLSYTGSFSFSEGQDKPILGFQVNPADNINIPMFIAKAKIEPNSFLSIDMDFSKPEGQRAHVKFGLFGELVINSEKIAEITGISSLTELPVGLLMPEISFALAYDTDPDKGFIEDSCYFGFASNSKTVSGFPINISELGLAFEGIDKIGLRCGLDLSLMDGPGIPAAGTTFTIFSKLNLTDDGLRIVYDRFEINAIRLDCNMNAITLKGQIEFYSKEIESTNDLDDRDRGVIGSLEVGLPVGVLQLEAQFGVFGNPPSLTDIGSFNEDYFPYFRIAGTLILKPGIPLGAPGSGFQLPIDLYGFGGGVQFNMFPTVNESSEDGQPGTVTYEPTYGAFGITASVILGQTVDPTPINGRVTLSVNIDINRGALAFGVKGELYLMTDISNWNNPKMYMKAEFNLIIPLSQPQDIELVGDFQAIVNFSISDDFGLKGKYQGSNDGTMIEGDLRICLEEQFINFGEAWMDHSKPDPRGNLNLSATIAGKGLQFDVWMYLMAGDNVPVGLPPLPREVVNIFNELNIIQERQNLSGPTSGFGFANGFQVRLDLDLGIPGWEDYASFKLNGNAGYDINISKYTGVTCSNNPRGQKELGLFGYYALGQAYLAVGLDVNIDVLSYKQSLSGRIGALVDAGFPNPFYLNGQLKVLIDIPLIYTETAKNESLSFLSNNISGVRYYDIWDTGYGNDYLSDLSEGHDYSNRNIKDYRDKHTDLLSVSFDFALGEKCNLSSDSNLSREDVSKLIISISPTNNQENFPITSIIKVQLAYKKGRNHLQTMGTDSDGNLKPINKTATLNILNAELKENGNQVRSFLNNIADGENDLTFRYDFKPSMNYEFYFKCEIKEGSRIIKSETKSIFFDTESWPMDISNLVDSCYPPRNREYVIMESQSNGHISFTRDMSEFFGVSSSSESSQPTISSGTTGQSSAATIGSKGAISSGTTSPDPTMRQGSKPDIADKYLLIIKDSTHSDTVEALYNPTSNRLTFPLNSFISQQSYKLTLIRTSRIHGAIPPLFSYQFSTSRFATYQDKLNDIRFESFSLNTKKLKISCSEAFDLQDLNFRIRATQNLEIPYGQNFISNFNETLELMQSYNNSNYGPKVTTNGSRNYKYRIDEIPSPKFSKGGSQRIEFNNPSSNVLKSNRKEYIIHINLEENQAVMKDQLIAFLRADIIAYPNQASQNNTKIQQINSSPNWNIKTRMNSSSDDFHIIIQGPSGSTKSIKYYPN